MPPEHAPPGICVGFTLHPLGGGDPRLLTGATLWGYIMWCLPKVQTLGGNRSGILVKPGIKMRNRSALNSCDLKTHRLLNPYQSLWVPCASLTHSSAPVHFEMPTSNRILRSDLRVSANTVPCMRQ